MGTVAEITMGKATETNMGTLIEYYRSKKDELIDPNVCCMCFLFITKMILLANNDIQPNRAPSGSSPSELTTL